MKFLTAKSHNVTRAFSYINWHELSLKVTMPNDLGELTYTQAKAKSPMVRKISFMSMNFKQSYKTKPLWTRVSMILNYG